MKHIKSINEFNETEKAPGFKSIGESLLSKIKDKFKKFKDGDLAKKILRDVEKLNKNQIKKDIKYLSTGRLTHRQYTILTFNLDEKKYIVQKNLRATAFGDSGDKYVIKEDGRTLEASESIKQEIFNKLISIC